MSEFYPPHEPPQIVDTPPEELVVARYCEDYRALGVSQKELNKANVDKQKAKVRLIEESENYNKKADALEEEIQQLTELHDELKDRVTELKKLKENMDQQGIRLEYGGEETENCQHEEKYLDNGQNVESIIADSEDDGDKSMLDDIIPALTTNNPETLATTPDTSMEDLNKLTVVQKPNPIEQAARNLLKDMDTLKIDLEKIDPSVKSKPKKNPKSSPTTNTTSATPTAVLVPDSNAKGSNN